MAEREAANEERNRLAREHDEATDPKARRALKPKVDRAIAAVKKLDEKLTAAQDLVTKRERAVDAAEAARKEAERWTAATFAELVAGEDALTDYSETSVEEAFAEAFALYKLDPKALERSNKRLHDWFKAHGELTGTAPAAARR